MSETSETSRLTKEERKKFHALFNAAQQVIIDLVEQEARLALNEEQEAPLELTEVQGAILDLTKEGMTTLKEMWNLIMITTPVPEAPECRPQYLRKTPLISAENSAPKADGDDWPEP